MRTFIAVKIPEPVKKDVFSFQNKLKSQFTREIKWVEPENIHLTMKFIGETKQEQIESINTVIQSCITNTKPFQISFDGAGAFPNLQFPKILWVDLKEGREKIMKLMISLNEKLADIGFEFETRELSPHLTIGRVKSPISNLHFPVFTSNPFEINNIYLIKSELTRDKPIYTDIKEFAL
ncbi:MAG: RNA 2',3'-cyclic phosphodiesterase [bacterium]|nr:RNA 2',3'-cyclic phosphodiesterase [bacterium]